LNPCQCHHQDDVEDDVGRERDEREPEVRPEVGPVPSPTGVKGYRGLEQRDHRHRGQNGTNRRDAGWQQCCGPRPHCITSWRGTSWAGSRTPGIATMRPPRVSTWTEANTTWPALGTVTSTAGSAFRRTTRHATGTGTRRLRLAKRRSSVRAPKVGR